MAHTLAFIGAKVLRIGDVVKLDGGKRIINFTIVDHNEYGPTDNPKADECIQDCVAWGKRADAMENVKEGDTISLYGKLKTRVRDFHGRPLKENELRCEGFIPGSMGR
jgi:single-stranded DNA-binding protein